MQELLQSPRHPDVQSSAQSAEQEDPQEEMHVFAQLPVQLEFVHADPQFSEHELPQAPEEHPVWQEEVHSVWHVFTQAATQEPMHPEEQSAFLAMSLVTTSI